MLMYGSGGERRLSGPRGRAGREGGRTDFDARHAVAAGAQQHAHARRGDAFAEARDDAWGGGEGSARRREASSGEPHRP